jgi:NTE family protein
MPFSEEGVQRGMGLALSGGGFRATLFHLGGFWRLNELGFLPKLDRISSVSGGSIASGLLGLRFSQLQFDAAGRAGNFGPLIVEPLRSFCARDVDAFAIAEGALLPWKKASDVIDKTYRDHLYGDATLQDLPAGKPRFVINSTNFATGVDFRFSRPYAGDYRIGLIRNPSFRISTAVAASSGFPPALSPVTIDLDPDSVEKTEGADLHDDSEFRKRLILTDGGVYDNLGLETVWNRYDTVLVSDAGAPFECKGSPATDWLSQALRALDVALNQAHALRKRALIADLQRGVRKGAYWGIGSSIAEYNLPDSLPCPLAVTSELASMRTRLNAFSESEQRRLINWGYAVCDTAMRRWMGAEDNPPAAWPYPDFALDLSGDLRI